MNNYSITHFLLDEWLARIMPKMTHQTQYGIVPSFSYVQRVCGVGSQCLNNKESNGESIESQLDYFKNEEIFAEKFGGPDWRDFRYADSLGVQRIDWPAYATALDYAITLREAAIAKSGKLIVKFREREPLRSWYNQRAIALRYSGFKTVSHEDRVFRKLRLLRHEVIKRLSAKLADTRVSLMSDDDRQYLVGKLCFNQFKEEQIAPPACSKNYRGTWECDSQGAPKWFFDSYGNNEKIRVWGFDDDARPHWVGSYEGHVFIPREERVWSAFSSSGKPMRIFEWQKNIYFTPNGHVVMFNKRDGQFISHHICAGNTEQFEKNVLVQSGSSQNRIELRENEHFISPRAEILRVDPPFFGLHSLGLAIF